MAADRVLSSKPCSLQNDDKSYTDGTFYVYQTLTRFMARGGSGQKLELEILDIKGQKRSKSNPLLMLETGKHGKPVLKFNTQEDREAVSAAIAQATEALQKIAADPASAAAAVAAAGPAAGAALTAGAGTAAAAPAAVQKPVGVQGEVQVSKELRQQLLATNKVIATQHRALVADSQALTDDEFWASAAVLRAAGVTGNPTVTQRSAKRGLANRLVDLARQNVVDKEGRLAQLRMTAEDEQQLLAENPALRQIYEASVPHQYKREEFWASYFKYMMAKRQKRDRAARRFKQLQQNLADSSAAAVAGMAGQQQEEQMQVDAAADFFSSLESSGLDADTRRAIKRRLNPLVDLAAAAEDRITPEGYGLAHNSARSELETVQGYSALTQELARDYNVHSAAVIGRPVPSSAAAAASRPGSSSAAAKRTSTPGGSSSGVSLAATSAAGRAGLEADSEMTAEDIRQYREQAGIVIEDLQAPLEQQLEELRVTDPRLYFRAMQQQPGQLQQQQQSPQSQHQQQQQQFVGVKAQQDVLQLLRAVDPLNLLDPPMPPAVAQQVLHELAGGDMASSGGRSLPSSLPPEYLDFVQQQSMVIDELLRHFWNLLPVNTEEKKAKFIRIRKSMDSCYEILNKHVQACQHVHKVPLTRLVKPLWEQLDLNISAAKNVERGLQAQQRRQQQQQRAAV